MFDFSTVEGKCMCTDTPPKGATSTCADLVGLQLVSMSFKENSKLRLLMAMQRSWWLSLCIIFLRYVDYNLVQNPPVVLLLVGCDCFLCITGVLSSEYMLCSTISYSMKQKG